jgi:gamma-glutamylcyclotransferase (GGCT)/AIG2-like uncharacterized protein YtfP
VSSITLLFVYGTLLSQAPAIPPRRALKRHAERVGPARIRGRLYGLRRFPALRPPLLEADWVTGEIWRLRQPRRTLAELDAYEGAEYRRVRRTAVLETGRELSCWVYQWRRPLAQWRRLAEGAWRLPAPASQGPPTQRVEAAPLQAHTG